MYMIKKSLVVLLSLLLLLGILGIPVYATEISQDGMQVTWTTDKAEYARGDIIVASLSVKNTNSFPVSDVSLYVDSYSGANLPRNKFTREGYGFAAGIPRQTAAESRCITVTSSAVMMLREILLHSMHSGEYPKPVTTLSKIQYS